MYEPLAVHMRPLVTPSWMAELDRMTIERGTPAYVLMERAGRAVARAVMQLTGGRYGHRVAVVCGKGNNGGDGYVVARLLRSEGLTVDCLSVEGAERPEEEAAALHFDLLRKRGGVVRVFDPRFLANQDVIVDALFGTGFRGRAQGKGERAIDAMNEAGVPIVAVDVPSGVDGANGSVAGHAVKATITVALAAEKLGTAVGRGAVLAGTVMVADIGIPIATAQGLKTTAAEVRRVLPHRAPDDHKRSQGSVAVIGGTAGMSGAVILAGRAAMRAGAGYVTVGVTEVVQPVVSAVVPEVLTRVLTTDEFLGAKALDEFKEVLDRASAVAVGPGLGQGDAQRALVTRVLEEVELPIVLDADALNVLAGNVETLRHRTAPTVITPHPAELGRLLDKSVEEIQADRLAAVTAAAETLGCLVILKGFRSLISTGSAVIVNPTGGPSLATAGTGDVLTGVVAAFLARGLEPLPAAFAAAYVHGSAGQLVPEGGVAWDVAEALPEAIARVRDRKPAPGAGLESLNA